MDTLRSMVAVGVTLGVKVAGTVAVGGSNVGGGLSVREGVSEGSGVLGGIVSLGVAAASWVSCSGVFSCWALRSAGWLGRGDIVIRIRIAPSIMAIISRSRVGSCLAINFTVLFLVRR